MNGVRGRHPHFVWSKGGAALSTSSTTRAPHTLDNPWTSLCVGGLCTCVPPETLRSSKYLSLKLQT